MVDYIEDTLGLITEQVFNLPGPDNVCMGNSGLYPHND